ncbi:MAG: methyltransferase domain-containing protein [Candidatus Marinimicrobia bacterium]|jgi:16S rRNA (guanine966-N2)-methyltransferase|nr:methyltransferase domain-containing protein [Candidatus Neomarinimicrobiota bacterium]MBT3576243.1 methyltransferase domain-containing protein [Candidatus Neomarinimicrobiota bacterium]MBT3680786.1 methyltransferase domain-containing protein [Candidatus Neomarinimicrobiota bacterium]MBT3950765.1 methyltransferase domain-containing protein [Candidatus Neomarinimicrobiota bacterium]MBT4252343.1 methyltransferase domain-containing protein [Candidatus Neomarinimicrobiota bacterium]
MTRIIAGEWRGHPLPKLKTGSVRPTTDRARTILFDTLRDVRDMQVLDLYSGTGALGFEALSRGAASLVSIDRDSKYINEQKLWMRDREKNFKAYVGDVQGVLRKLTQKFDLILADPPYAEKLSSTIMHLIEAHGTENAYFVYESARRDETSLDSDVFKLLKEKVVAETRIQIYKAH